MVVSDTVVDHMIRVWRIARLSRDLNALDYPSISLIARCMQMGGTDGVFSGQFRTKVPDGSAGISDAEQVQTIVNRMPAEIKQVFEAYHLGLVRGDNCRKMPHKGRARTLGISPSTYFKRRNAGFSFLRGWLEITLDRAEHFDQNMVG